MTTKREERRAKRLEEITDVATEMIVESGIAEFSLNRLAERLELTPGALYRYFDSRDAILVSVELRVLRTFDAFLRGVLEARRDSPPLQQVVALIYGYVALEEIHPERFRLMSQFVSGPAPVVADEAATEVIGPTLALLGIFAPVLEATAEDGAIEPGPAIRRTALLWSCVQGILDRRKLARFSRDLFDPESLIDELVASLLLGWGASPSDLAAALEARPPISFYVQLLEES